MPFYEYECTKCNNHTELFQKISDPPITKCEACKGKMKKVISQTTFHLKGSGWYVTDYASGSKTNSGKSGSESSKDASGKEVKDSSAGAAKVESKPKETKSSGSAE